ncbi:hypothetical protein [Mycoplasma sp. 3686d]|uniref:hypothetical protein n=1 Tax=Mycoplasma sp. 3686d TaxID=2967300 RepID=UPI00211BB57F|nr:hypothetical protein [Mycoplasma sp. 3686d]UUM24643.1 hypothetical protein NPA12_03025 [Mycoplasma sp. 3686d]
MEFKITPQGKRNLIYLNEKGINVSSIITNIGKNAGEFNETDIDNMFYLFNETNVQDINVQTAFSILQINQTKEQARELRKILEFDFSEHSELEAEYLDQEGFILGETWKDFIKDDIAQNGMDESKFKWVLDEINSIEDDQMYKMNAYENHFEKLEHKELQEYILNHVLENVQEQTQKKTNKNILTR